VHHLPRITAPHIRFVSLLGGLPRQMSATPFDVVHRLAEKTGADAYLLPVPFYANTAADRPVLLAQRGVAEALDHAAQATLHVVGIGEVTREAFLTISGVVATDELAALLRTGAAGEMLGRYFDAAGRLVRTNLHERVVALAPEAMRGREVVAVAGGVGKAAAIRAVLTSGLPNGLITDEPTARRLLDSDNCRAESKGSEECTTKRKTSAKRSSPAALAGGS
jgi:DNA-binding transcriptional regulator LsrR (DeoR family)